MPLSDAARRLLAAKTGQAPPPDLPPEPEPEAKPEATEEQQGFRDRARREDERFRLATDSEYWLVLCFRTPTDAARFKDAAGVRPDDRRYIPGPALDRALAHLAEASKLDRARRMLTARSTRGQDLTGQLAQERVTDPIDPAPVTGDLQADTAAECAALLTALTTPPDPNPPNVLDSPHWLAVYWPSRDPKDTFLERTGLDVLGDKYLDGHQAGRILNLPGW